MAELRDDEMTIDDTSLSHYSIKSMKTLRLDNSRCFKRKEPKDLCFRGKLKWTKFKKLKFL